VAYKKTKLQLECVTGKRMSVKHLMPICDKIYYKSLSTEKLYARGESGKIVGYKKGKNSY
jgi:hypothetical protein